MLKIAIPKTETVGEVTSDKIGLHLQSLATTSKKKNAFRILYKNQVLTMPSGKSVWGRVGDAKSALWNALDFQIYKMLGPDFYKENIVSRKEKIKNAKELLLSMVVIKELE